MNFFTELSEVFALVLAKVIVFGRPSLILYGISNLLKKDKGSTTQK